MERYLFFVIMSLIILLSSSLGHTDIIVIEGVSYERKIEGEIIDETATHLIIKNKGPGTTQVPKERVKRIKKTNIAESELWTDQDVYFQKLKDVSPDDAQGNLKIGLWCFDKEFYTSAYRHLKIATDLEPDLMHKVEDKIEFLENLLAENIYISAKDCFYQGNYLAAEIHIFSILSQYPKSKYVKHAKRLLYDIWGREISKRILEQKDKLPAVALHPRQIPRILKSLGTEKLKRQ